MAKKTKAQKAAAEKAAAAEAAEDEGDEGEDDGDEGDDSDDGDDAVEAADAVEDNDEDLFEKPRVSPDGDFWPPEIGTYLGMLVAFKAGPTFTNTNKAGEEEERQMVRWVRELSRINGKPMFYRPTEGKQAGKKIRAVGDSLTSMIISPKSAAGKAFAAHLQRTIDFKNETRADLMKESLGTTVMVTYSENDNGKITVGEGGIAAYIEDDGDDDDDD